MLSRWKIEESPTKGDPNRRLLFVKGSLADVHGLIRKLGAVCGRPKKEKGNAEFNFSLSLRKLSDEELSEIESEMRSIHPDAASASTPKAAPAAEPEPDSGFGEGGSLPIELALASGDGPAPVEEAPMPAPVPAPVPTVEETAADDVVPISLSPVPEPAASAGGLNLSPTAEASPAPFAGQGPPIALRQEVAPGITPSTPEAVPLAGAGPGEAVESVSHKLASQALFGAVTERIVSHSLDNFIVGAFNRFAHAGGMSILTSPGSLYQPLFVSGLPGSGKTHLLHALADKLQQQTPEEPVWITSGSRLARAAAWAVSENRFQELEEFAAKARALIVDDLQFMGIAEHNRTQLVSLFKSFMDAGKQIILASAYPAEMIVAIEQALEIRISGGHTVEVKVATGDKRLEAVKGAMESAGLTGVEAEVSAFAQSAVGIFGELGWTLRRAKALESLRLAAGQPAGLADLHPTLFQAEAGEPQVIAAEELEKKSAETPSPAGGARRLLLLYPQGQEAHAEWTLRRVAVAGQINSWSWPFAEAVRRPYAVDPAPTVPFVLAEEAYQGGADAALVLGPQPGADLAENEGDCRYVVQHLLGEGGVPLAWMPYRRVHDPKFHLHAFLDLQCAPAPGSFA
ncbi:MAG: hypothetical protein AUJ52_15100 [Elusimicrobia bacterium CG1_02_63_36]|nr:MAG: hypothetical protein AUJ52_15100 [Elusimicrobia bacterium CG1_02_63_36]PIP84968.1 MAG: hypothetical protein COR54_01235 [Elusimicrobia bacterium CG22_combo_CG10-13_8_21_14_all_63_91]PJA12386.1 MAG: hypothetical protein COX66_17520 [Elusimicrobia bacterium CG_4_10_14_0_2_um_filter_63_34]PJB26165.1 MAG: hypothetical protein CO113_04940 [Elusimicrobia bacterium CG_4_9_14_3_um_filter_62_55]